MLKRFIAWLDRLDDQDCEMAIALFWTFTALVILLSLYAMGV